MSRRGRLLEPAAELKRLMDELYRTKEQPAEEKKPKKQEPVQRLPWAPPLMLD